MASALTVVMALVALACHAAGRTDSEQAGQALVNRYKSMIENDRVQGHLCETMMAWNVCNYAAVHFWDGTLFSELRTLDTTGLFAALDHQVAVGGPRVFRVLLKTTQVHAFFRAAWPVLLKHTVMSYVVVTCCSDETLESTASLLAALDSPQLVGWFAQNAAVVHPKLVPVPIGLNFHALAKRPALNTPETQNTLLLGLRDRALAESRQLTVLVSFNAHPELRRGVEVDLRRSLPGRAVRRLSASSRQVVWRRYLSTEFVASPPGNGKDCHRTWEALALGAIPIVLRDPPFDRVYTGFPVALVNSYRNITIDQLEAWRTELRPAMDALLRSPQRLTSRYWMERIVAAGEGRLTA